MDTGAWQATVHGVQTVAHNLVTKQHKDSRTKSCLQFSESHLTSNHEEQPAEERIPSPSTVSQGT